MTQALQPAQAFKLSLDAAMPELKKVISSDIDVEKFMRVALTTIQNNPSLLEKDRRSLFSALHSCAQDGLMPDGREAALVPFKGDIKYTPMVAGYFKRARNSGEIGSMDAAVVYSNDEFEEWADETGPHFKHKKATGERGDRVGAYAYAVTKDKFLYFEYMAAKEIEAAKKMSRSQHVWNGDFGDEMWRKTVVRRLCKHRLPSASDMTNMLRADAEEYAEHGEATDAAPKPKAETSSKLSSLVAERSAAPAQAEVNNDVPI